MKALGQTGWVAALGAVSLLVAAGCSQSDNSPWPDRPGPRVLTTFAPLYCFAASVAGDDATVQCLMTERGPHHFEPSAKDALRLNRADLFVANGLELDDIIAGKLKSNAGNPSLRLLKAANHIPPPDLRAFTGGEHDHDKCDCCAHGNVDPHVWLGIPEAIRMVESIRDQLKEIDSNHAANYDHRAATYIAELKKLQEEGRELLKDKKERKLLTFHDSLYYFAKTFGLEVGEKDGEGHYHPYTVQVRPGAEPGANELARLVDLCQKKGVRLIAIEPQYLKSTADTVVEELRGKGIADAEAILINPLETARPEDLTPDLYVRTMRANLQTLAKHLK